MSTIHRKIAAPADSILDMMEGFAQKKFKKTAITRTPSSLTVQGKMLWQTQTTTITINGDALEASGNNPDAINRGLKMIVFVSDLLDDQGWNAMIEKHNMTTMNNDHAKNSILNKLDPHETVIAATQGFTLKKSIYLAATNRHVMLLESDSIGFDSSVQTIPLDKISSLKADRGRLMGEVKITTSNEEIAVEKVFGDEAQSFVNALNQYLNRPADTPAQAEASSGVNDLAKLADLHKQGILTDAEFSAAKAKALGI